MLGYSAVCTKACTKYAFVFGRPLVAWDPTGFSSQDSRTLLGAGAVGLGEGVVTPFVHPIQTGTGIGGFFKNLTSLMVDFASGRALPENPTVGDLQDYLVAHGESPFVDPSYLRTWRPGPADVERASRNLGGDFTFAAVGTVVGAAVQGRGAPPATEPPEAPVPNLANVEPASNVNPVEPPPVESTPKEYGPFNHQLNKGGLQDIMENQRMISTEARTIAGGGAGVRAMVGEVNMCDWEQVPNYAVNADSYSRTVIEFYTTEEPVIKPNGQATWPIPDGDYLPIILTKVKIFLHY